MFHVRLKEATNHDVDLDTAMSKMIGVTPSDLWLLCYAIFIFYAFECAKKDGPWVLSPDSFLANASDKGSLSLKLNEVLHLIAKSPQELRTIYDDSGKYQDEDLPTEYWTSEFNILRDFPLIKFDEEKYLSLIHI